MVNSVSNSTNGASLAGALTGGSALGKEDFLRLLVTQLQNQDPLNPQDPTEFTAQLAQFSSLEQLFGVNDSLAQMAQSANDSSGLDRLSALSMIGRRVEVAGPGFQYSGQPVEFGYTLDAPAAGVTVRIVNDQGQTVAVLPEAGGEAGAHMYAWDGTGLNGQPLPPGSYLVEAERLDNGETSPVATRISSVVTGVDLEGMTSILNTAAGDFRLDQVVSVTGA